jgi:AraC family transcriptional regulator, regulatory protein of adaptative response / methylated-DNA-[protein]-cysteine methyltransferase
MLLFDAHPARASRRVSHEKPSATLPPGMPLRLDPESMYRAIAERDVSLLGAFFVGVKTTGVFCRVGCPSRVPLRENCEFFSCVAGALQAGYRACLRCTPLASAVDNPPWATAILERIEADPARVVTAADIRRAGADPAAASRYFTKRFGVSVQAISRARRVGLAMRWLRDEGSLRTVMHRAGFDSESGLRKAVSELFGVSIGDARAIQTDSIATAWLATPLGPMLGGVTDRGVCLLEFIDRRGLGTQLQTLRRRLRRPIIPGTHARLDALRVALAAYFAPPRSPGAGTIRQPLDVPGTPFQQQVWDELIRVAPGTTCSYTDLARRIGRPTAVRAVARANGDNRIALIIPCHRIVGSTGDLTGYAGGLWRKQWLLDHERACAAATPTIAP